MEQSLDKAPRRGVAFALGASVLFGMSTPLAKLLLSHIPAVLLASLFYLGSGFGLALWQGISYSFLPGYNQEAPLRKHDLAFLAGAIAFGGVCGPVLLLLGLSQTPASTSSLLLNLEGVFTAMLAWFAFNENYDRRIVIGMASVVAGGAVLVLSSTNPFLFLTAGSGLIAAACLCWALDNNLTRKVSHADPVQITMLKGLVAGTINLLLCLFNGIKLPALSTLAWACCLGFLSYGISLVLYVLALRHLGSARTGAYFSLAPFIGAFAGIVLLREPLTTNFMVAAALMAVGLYLHLSENHDHEHHHDELVHEHIHYHDEHHRHEHCTADPPGEPHTHVHRHQDITHKHRHFPDTHHGHDH